MGDYRSPAVGDLGELRRRLGDLERQLREEGRASGTQTADALATLTDLVNNLQQEIEDVSASGAVWQGPVSAGAGNIVTTTGYIFTAAGYAYDITYTRRTAWLGNDGRLGWASSSITAKELLDSIPEPDVLAIIDLIESHHYHRIPELEKAKADPNYHVATEWGAVAEELHALGLWQLVIYEWDTVWDLREVLVDGAPIVDADGMVLKERVEGSERRVEGSEPRPVGIHYELFGLLATVGLRQLVTLLRKKGIL